MLIGDCKVKRICLGILLSFFGFSLGAGHFFIQNKSDSAHELRVRVKGKSRLGLPWRTTKTFVVRPGTTLTVPTKYSNSRIKGYLNGSDIASYLSDDNRCFMIGG